MLKFDDVEAKKSSKTDTSKRVKVFSISNFKFYSLFDQIDDMALEISCPKLRIFFFNAIDKIIAKTK